MNNLQAHQNCILNLLFSNRNTSIIISITHLGYFWAIFMSIIYFGCQDEWDYNYSEIHPRNQFIESPIDSAVKVIPTWKSSINSSIVVSQKRIEKLRNIYFEVDSAYLLSNILLAKLSTESIDPLLRARVLIYNIELSSFLRKFSETERELGDLIEIIENDKVKIPETWKSEMYAFIALHYCKQSKLKESKVFNDLALNFCMDDEDYHLILKNRMYYALINKDSSAFNDLKLEDPTFEKSKLVNANRLLGQYFLEFEEYEKSLFHLQQALEHSSIKNPRNTNNLQSIIYMLGEVYNILGYSSKSTTTLNKIIDHSPRTFITLAMLGQTLMRDYINDPTELKFLYCEEILNMCDSLYSINVDLQNDTDLVHYLIHREKLNRSGIKLYAYRWQRVQNPNYSRNFLYYTLRNSYGYFIEDLKSENFINNGLKRFFNSLTSLRVFTLLHNEIVRLFHGNKKFISIYQDEFSRYTYTINNGLEDIKIESTTEEIDSTLLEMEGYFSSNVNVNVSLLDTNLHTLYKISIGKVTNNDADSLIIAYLMDEKLSSFNPGLFTYKLQSENKRIFSLNFTFKKHKTLPLLEFISRQFNNPISARDVSQYYNFSFSDKKSLMDNNGPLAELLGSYLFSEYLLTHASKVISYAGNKMSKEKFVSALESNRHSIIMLNTHSKFTDSNLGDLIIFFRDENYGLDSIKLSDIASRNLSNKVLLFFTCESGNYSEVPTHGRYGIERYLVRAGASGFNCFYSSTSDHISYTIAKNSFLQWPQQTMSQKKLANILDTLEGSYIKYLNNYHGITLYRHSF